ncbi:RagB/SusD family nutrient uptake outer membrane protein [uncultured Mucilaginibacter sp.]|uniref:RagB/SusD family nutrient uptake outer membrane protein n=1 Tax=uncultured Mucilaginibacter sp. TaxID=797541 RepID=UPI0025EFA5FD|nr:RagB/SusD family nutrient uptake outer membrane protein [uncultured Mucilaginibacter sp.]
MKKYIKYLIGMGAIVGMATTGCKKDFFNRPPENEPTVGTYYQTTAQVQASTNILYAAPWFGFNGKAFLATGEVLSGNARCYVGADPEFGAYANYTEGNATPIVTSTWNSLFTVVAQANALLNNLPTAVPASVPSSVKNNALGEAHLMRAAAYFYLVRIFGNVPIITNPTAFVGTFQTVPANYVTDVYQFMINDLQFAEANCTPGVASTGHASSGSASALLAKVYLYEQDYANAKKEAEKVINSGEFGLLGIDVAGVSYNDLYKTANNNNKESILAMQWSSNAGYGFGSQLQSVIALNSTITGTGDGYGELGPTFDLQNAYKAAGDTIRRHGTIMIPGDYYPEIDKATGGYKVPLNASAQGTAAGLKKYVVGTPADNNGLTAFQATSNNTYIMRYAEVYLIEAEAVMGLAANPGAGHGIDTNYTTSDPTALKYINLVRKRAGLGPYAGFTYRQLIKERRLEFAIEGDYWYDLQRIDGFNSATHPVAEAIEASTNKGDSYGATAPNYNNYTINHTYIVPTDAQFIIPIPATDAAADPNLTKPPVHYKF